MTYFNLTPEENFRYFGVVPKEQLEDLFDAAARVDAVDDVAGYLSEAKGCYPAEDFLHMEISELRQFAKKMRGDNKLDFENLIERIEHAVNEQNGTAEHGVEHIELALKKIQ